MFRTNDHCKWLALAASLVCAISPLRAEEPTLAEDPFALAKQQHQQLEEQPWVSRSPQELQLWAKDNLHFKLRARTVIDADAHPEWEWFRQSGFGLFLHWGLASVAPNTGDAWAMVYSKHRNQESGMLRTPEEMFSVADTWNPASYDPDKWMAAASKAGFGYAVLTTRHHDGYGLWPSEQGDWDTGDKMNGRDLVKDYVEACRNNDIRIGFYYSGPNWHFDYKNKDFSWPPQGYNYKHEKVELDPPLAAVMGYDPPLPGDGDLREQAQSTEQVRELMTNYGPIDMMWWDGNSIMTPEALAELQPDIFVARGLIATPEGMHHGTSENVKVTNEAGWWWELCIKTENTNTPNWHYGAINETNHWNTNKFLSELVRCRSLGGNLLVNITPRPNGEMMDWFYDVCDEMGEWMQHSREAIYAVDLDAPLPTLDQTQNFTTKKGNNWYAMPDARGAVFITDVAAPKSVTLLRSGETLDYEFRDSALRVEVPAAMQTELPDMVKIVFAGAANL